MKTPKADPDTPHLPRLVHGDRKGILALLIGVGLLLAVLAGLTAMFMIMLLGSGADQTGAVIAGTGLVTAALGIGVLRSVERVLAERLGQSYVQQIRLGLIDSALTAENPPPSGITIARTTNDLTSVRNWVALGIAPLAVGIPLILGASSALALLSPILALAALIPLMVLTTIMVFLAKMAFDRAKKVRRRRGKLASLLADTITAAPAIKASGGEKRELRRIGRAGQGVVDAAIDRSKITGSIRGAAAATAAIAVAAVGIAGLWQAVDIATIAGALTVVGLMSTPVADLGRVVEYRQNFKAARRILGPALVHIDTTSQRTERGNVTPKAVPTGPQPLPPGEGVSIAGPGPCDICPPHTLVAAPGDVIIVDTIDPAHADSFFSTLLGLRNEPAIVVCVNGIDLTHAEAEKKRQLVGYAAAGSYLERGSIERAVRYRRPDLHQDQGTNALQRVGLAATIETLPKGQRTQLRRGGEPLTISERARLQLARATLATPPLLILNRIDTELDNEGQLILRQLIINYPGVVLIAPGHPDNSCLPDSEIPEVKHWSIDCPHRTPEVIHDTTALTPTEVPEPSEGLPTK